MSVAHRSVAGLIGLVLVISLTGAAHGQGDTLDPGAHFDAPYSDAYEETMVNRMKAGINRFLDRLNPQVTGDRDQYWDRDFSSRASYAQSVEDNRARLRELIGVVDERTDVYIEKVGRHGNSALVAETDAYTVHQVRWPSVEGVWSEGLLLTPMGVVDASVVALPDADQTPEQIVGLSSGLPSSQQYARRLAESGVQVLVPTLINRRSDYSVLEDIVPFRPWFDRDEPMTIQTNMPHREWIYRQAYVNGRHIIGYEVQKALAGVDWLTEQNRGQPVGLVGYGEGGLIALYASAVDRRIDATMVSGYFGPREDLWREPVYRNVWGLLKRFGDAEIASLIAPRKLVVEHSVVPDVDGPPPAGEDVVSAAVEGRLETPTLQEVQQEVERLQALFPDGAAVQPDVDLVFDEQQESTTGPGSEAALGRFQAGLNGGSLAPNGTPPRDQRSQFEPDDRQKRLVQGLTDHLHDFTLIETDENRYKFLDGDRSSARTWYNSMEPYRDTMYNELIGRIEQERLQPSADRRQVFDRENWTGYEVVLDVFPDVFAWGLLAVPKDLEEGEKRPVVIVQHGIGGTPTTAVDVDSYNNILPRLASRGFVVFAPHNPYQFNVRKATPLKKSVFSFIIPQNKQIVDYLQSLDYVDDERIGYYGKSWGGRAALRIGPFIEDLDPVISAAYFNYWPRKVLSTNWRTTYMFTGSIGVYEWNQGNTFGHAEMAMLMAPRHFMVETGIRDAVAPHEWVGHEFLKVKRLYELLGIGHRARLGLHIGGHEVHGDTIFPFLHNILQWPAPATK